jgi:hypothetical protein
MIITENRMPGPNMLKTISMFDISLNRTNEMENEENTIQVTRIEKGTGLCLIM